MNKRGAIKAFALAALLAPITGCSTTGPIPVAPAAERAPEQVNMFSNVFPDNQYGLEVQWWTVTDVGDALARALAPYAEAPSPMPEAVRANWRRNGLRLVRIPVEKMGGLLLSLPIEDRVNRIWLGQTPDWTVAAPGAPWSGTRSLLIDGETIRLGAGQLRLLVRAWISPTEGLPTLRADLALQYLDSRRSAPTRSAFSPAVLRRPEEEGMIFRTLSAPMELAGAYAYCIVSEDPETDWSEVVRADERGDAPAVEETEPTLPERAPDPFVQPEATDEDPSLGPAPPGIPLLADALLSRVDLLPTRRMSRTIVILTPVVPDEYRLAPTGKAPINTPN